MRGFDKGVYRAVLRVRAAYAFDANGFLMRIYACMATIGSISMLTLAGYSFFIAGTVSSTIALATFFLSPRVSKLADEKGQHAVVPKAAITLIGLALMLAVPYAHPTSRPGVTSWLNSGSISGLAFGPTLGGVVIDEVGTTASFDFGAVLAFMIPVIVVACIPVLKRRRGRR